MRLPPIALAAGTLLIGLSGSPTPFAGQPAAAVAGADRPGDAQPLAGDALYADNCAACHEGGIPRAPHRDWLAKMAPDAVLDAMNRGTMQQEAAQLSAQQREAVTEYLTGVDLASYRPPPGPPACTDEALAFDLAQAPARAGWGYDTTRFVPPEAAGLTKRQVARLELKWAYAFPGAIRARSLPVVAMGAVFVGSQNGTVHAFDLVSGCARWHTRVSAEVRTAIVVEPWADGEKPPTPPRVFFGDLMGRVYALNALTGEVLWQRRADDHPNATITGTPSFHDGTLFVPVSSLEVITAADAAYPCCTFRGSVVALDAADGRLKWRHYTIEQPAVELGRTSAGTRRFGPSGAAVWSSPAVDADRGLIYFGSSENYSSPADGNSDAVFAVDLETGARRWRRQLLAGDAWNGGCYFGAATHPNCPPERGPEMDVSAAPVLAEAGGRQLLIAAQKSGMVFGLDPDNGRPAWQRQVGRGGVQGGIHFGVAVAGTRIYVPIVDIPQDSQGRVIDEPGVPGLHAVDAATGNVLWSSLDEDNCGGRKFCDPGISAAVTAIEGVIFAGHLDGMLRAYDSETGAILWARDTSRPVPAVNGTATGGSIGGPGPAVSRGHVIVNSGYDFGDHMAGNALLVYSVDGK